jgi:hypothetical protein
VDAAPRPANKRHHVGGKGVLAMSLGCIFRSGDWTWARLASDGQTGGWRHIGGKGVLAMSLGCIFRSGERPGGDGEALIIER